MTYSARLARFLCLFIGCTTALMMRGMVWDNAFLPLMQRPVVPSPCQPTHILADGVFITADESFSSSQEQVPLPAIYGPFDLGFLGNSLDSVGLPNPIRIQRPAWIGQDIPYLLEGKLQAQGLSVNYQQGITQWLSIGVWGLILRSRSRWDYNLVTGSVPGQTPTALPVDAEGNALEVDQLRREILQELGLSCGLADQFGPGDTELYIRLVQNWDFTWKFRHIMLEFFAGALIATGVKRDINNPASIPFGGNGHNGWFLALSGYFELREDFWFRFYTRVNDRLAKTRRERMPVGQLPEGTFSLPIGREPQPFGVVVGDVRIDPGPTFILTPYFMFENLRDGLGLGIGYYLIHHWPDTWTDARPAAERECVPVFISRDSQRSGQSIEERSQWGRDFVSLLAFYDFGVNELNRVGPVLSATWDVPTGWFVAERSFKAHRVVIGLQMNF